MALGVQRKNSRKAQTISQVSWTDGTSLDPYYWLEHSFQYSRNINCDDEIHWLKLSQKAIRYDDTGDAKLWKCQLVSAWDIGVIALPVWNESTNIRVFNEDNFDTGWEYIGGWRWGPNCCPGVVFQEWFWYWIWVPDNNQPIAGIRRIQLWAGTVVWETFIPHDHTNTSDDAIADEHDDNGGRMHWPITAILNYNNSRLVVADGQDIWVYYPELDTLRNGTQWRKKTLSFEAGVDIVWLTCTFEYLKIWCRDEWWNSKVYYYQGNNNLRDTFVYNVVDLFGQRITRVFSINSVDYYITSTDGSDWYVNLNKLVWVTPIQLFKQRAWLTKYDVNRKAPYFVWPVSLDAPYQSWKYYIADRYWVFCFDFNPQWYDTWYMKRGLNDYDIDTGNPTLNGKRVYGSCINKNFLYVSDDDWCWKIRIYDTWVDWYQDAGILVSREFEGLEGWTITKMLESIKINFELNPVTTGNGTIDVYVSPNNLRKDTNLYGSTYKLPKGTWLPLNMEDYYDNTSYDWWFHVMHIDQNNIWTRMEKSELINKLGPSWISAFEFDWQTITYAIVINKGTQEKATPIVRQIDINYYTKEKLNDVYNLNNRN